MRVNYTTKLTNRENPHMIWESDEKIWYVLQTFQSSKEESGNPDAKWLCDVVKKEFPSISTISSVPVREIKSVGIRIR